MCCSSGRPVSARRRWRRSWRASSGSISARPPGRSSPRPAISRRCTNLEERVLFIDEIHRLNPPSRRSHPAMEDYQLDLIIGEGPAARSVKIDLAEIHAGRRDHAARPAHQSAARPVRHSGQAELLHGRGTGADRQARRASLACRSATTAPSRSPGARAARASPITAARACDFASVAGVDRVTRRWPTRRCSGSGRCARPRPLDRRYLSMIATNSAAVGRHRDDCGGPVRAARRHRGHHRALSHPAGFHPAHTARPGADGQRMAASGAGSAEGPGATADQSFPGRELKWANRKLSPPDSPAN